MVSADEDVIKIPRDSWTWVPCYDAHEGKRFPGVNQLGVEVLVDVWRRYWCENKGKGIVIAEELIK